ncbi:unnamed protein product, partial [Durusdinium trenchii]
DWQAECQRITLLVHVWEKMQSAVCRDGKALFDRELLKKLKNNILEGDYNDEANTILFCMEPMWSHECCSMWSENEPKVVEKTNKSQIATADSQIQQLGNEARKALWESDCMKLARDIAMLSRLHADTVKSDAAKRLQKICHLRQQNVVGSGIITNFMEQNCAFVSGNQKDLESSLNKFIRENDARPIVMWVDLMKIGRVGQQELNNLVDLLGVALHSRPTASCAIIIAPFLISEKVSNGLRGEVASGSTILLCNLTSYDCCLEQVALTWNGEHSKDVRIKSLLPSESRSRWLEDPTYGPEWRKLLDDFDHHFDPQFAKSTEAGSIAGGAIVEVDDESVAHTTVELTTNEFLIAHGPSKWLSAEQVDKFRRQKRVGLVASGDVLCQSVQDEPETGANLKTIYWKHINEAKERILQENPELTKREALRKAQSES